MAEIEKKTVKVSKRFDVDIAYIFEFGEETFGYTAVKKRCNKMIDVEKEIK